MMPISAPYCAVLSLSKQVASNEYCYLYGWTAVYVWHNGGNTGGGANLCVLAQEYQGLLI